MKSLLFPASLLATTLALPAVQEGAERKGPPDQRAATAAVSTATAPALELTGTVIPAAGAELEVWPQAYGGELLILEVLPHGTRVQEGDRLALIEDRSYRQQLRSAEMKFQEAEERVQNLAARGENEALKAQADLQRQQQRLDSAMRDWEGWQTFGQQLEQRGADLSALSYQHRIDDQQAELAQLESMYADDQLVDATEDIVLVRGRRDLERSLSGQALQADQRRYREGFELQARQLEKQQNLERLRGELARLESELQVQARERRARQRSAELAWQEAREQVERMRADLELFELKAPASGLLLHGSLRDYANGGARPEHRRGARLAPRAVAFTIAQARPWSVQLQVDENRRQRLLDTNPSGPWPVSVSCTGMEEPVTGRLTLEALPMAGAAAAKFRARVDLEGQPPALPFGLAAKVEVPTAAQVSTWVVPQSAFSPTGSGPEGSLWIQDAAGEFARTEVRKVDGGQGGEIHVQGPLGADSRVLLFGDQQGSGR